MQVSGVAWAIYFVLILQALYLSSQALGSVISLLIPVFILFGLFRYQRRDVAMLQVLANLKEDGPHMQLPVEITLSQEGVMYDRDYGHVSFLEGTLYYSGLRTTFSFSPRAARHPAHSLRTSSTLQFFHQGLTHTVRFRHLSSNSGDKGVSTAMVGWANARTKAGGVEVLPPPIPSKTARLRAAAAPRLLLIGTGMVSAVPIALYTKEYLVGLMAWSEFLMAVFGTLVVAALVIIVQGGALSRRSTNLEAMAQDELERGIKRQ